MMATVNLVGNLEDFERDIEALLQDQQQEQIRPSFDRERDVYIYRSGSAPPTVEGSRDAIRSLFDGQNTGDGLSEEEMRSHLAYMSDYYSNENHNSRLSPPLLSKENWRAACVGRKQLVEDDGSSSSLFSVQPSLSEPAEHDGGDCPSEGCNGLIGLPDIDLVGKKESFVDALQVVQVFPFALF